MGKKAVKEGKERKALGPRGSPIVKRSRGERPTRRVALRILLQPPHEDPVAAQQGARWVKLKLRPAVILLNAAREVQRLLRTEGRHDAPVPELQLFQSPRGAKQGSAMAWSELRGKQVRVALLPGVGALQLFERGSQRVAAPNLQPVRCGGLLRACRCPKC